MQVEEAVVPHVDEDVAEALETIKLIVNNQETFHQPPHEISRLLAEFKGQPMSTSIYSGLNYSSLTPRSRTAMAQSHGAVEITASLA